MQEVDIITLQAIYWAGVRASPKFEWGNTRTRYFKSFSNLDQVNHDSWILSFRSVEEKMNREGKGGWYLEKDPSGWSFARDHSILTIICNRLIHPDDYLQEVGPSGWSFGRGWSILMIICKMLIHQNDHLLKANPSRWSFLGGQLIRMIICKRSFHPDDYLQRLIHPDDHLQKASPPGWSFVRGRSTRMIIWKRPVHQDGHLQETGLSGWSFARGLSIRIIICIGCELLFVVCRCLSIVVFRCVSVFSVLPKRGLLFERCLHLQWVKIWFSGFTFFFIHNLHQQSRHDK